MTSRHTRGVTFRSHLIQYLIEEFLQINLSRVSASTTVDSKYQVGEEHAIKKDSYSVFRSARHWKHLSLRDRRDRAVVVVVRFRAGREDRAHDHRRAAPRGNLSVCSSLLGS